MSSMTPIDTTHPEKITYSTEELQLTVLGGIKLEGLDRLRVTLKLEITDRKFKHYLNNPEIADLALRHNLDLYNDTQVEKLVRRAAERLELGSSHLSKSIAELTDGLEHYRLEQIEQQGKEIDTRKNLNKEEQNAATNFLKGADLLKRTNDLIGQSGVIGELTNRLLMYLIFTSRKRDHPLHIVSLGSSGTGKTHLQESVGQLIPEEDKLEITVLSENAFYYFGQRELKNKLILIEDLDGAENVLYPLRELQSKKKISKTVAHKDSSGNTKTIHLTVEGPVSVAGCTTKEKIYEDNANRSFLIHLDESPEQDENIMEHQRALSAGLVDTNKQHGARALLCDCQRILRPITVHNPYAPQLKIPREVFKPRRSNSHYLAFIEAVTFYHQYQREEKVNEATGEIHIETTLGDIKAANELINEVLLRKSDELSGACRNYFERLKTWLQEEQKTAFTNRQARAALRENHSNQKRYMIRLQQEGLLKRSTGNKKQGFYYEVINAAEYETLKAGVIGVLDDILLNIQEKNGRPASGQVQSSEEVQQANEPLKATPEKENSKKFTSSPAEVSEGKKVEKLPPKRRGR